MIIFDENDQIKLNDDKIGHDYSSPEFGFPCFFSSKRYNYRREDDWKWSFEVPRGQLMKFEGEGEDTTAVYKMIEIEEEVRRGILRATNRMPRSGRKT